MADDADPAWYSKHLKAKITRQAVRLRVPCPFCEAEAGRKCIGVRGQVRSAMHQERWELYREYRDRTEIH